MSSPAQVAANRINCLKSQGATTPEGQAKSSMNALKHGLRSKKVEMMREDSYAFENRLNKWLAIGDAQSDVDEYLIFRNVSLSFDVDRAGNARFQRCKSLIENSDEVELTEIHELGARLFFFEPAGPTPLFGNLPTFAETKKTSRNREAVNPNDPAVLVKKMERSEAGVRYLCDCWQALRQQLALPGFWQSQDRLKAIRLLGRDLVNHEDRRVAEIFVASHGLNPVRKNEFDDLLGDLDEDQRDRFRKGLVERWPDLFRARDKAECRQILLDLVDRNIERLNAKLEVHEANADAVAEATVARLNFDPSPEGVALRNQQMKSLNALFRGMENYRKHKRRAKGRGKRAGGVAWHERDLDSSANSGGEAEDSYGSALGHHHSSVSADREGACLEPRVDYSDWVARAAQSSCGTDLATAAIPPNETNEANFDENVNIIQEQYPVEVTANSGAQSGLDNAVVQRREGSEPEQAGCGTGESDDAISENVTIEARCGENVSAVASADLPDRAPQSACGTAEATDAVSENETNEANFDENVVIAQHHHSVDIVAISDAQSALDNGVVQPDAAHEPEQEEVRKSASEIGNPKWQNAEWADYRAGGGVPATLMKQETIEQRLAEERMPVGNLGDGHLARQLPVSPPDATEPPKPDDDDDLPNLAEESTAASADPIMTGELKTQVLRELRHRQLEASASDVFSLRDGRGHGSKNQHEFRKPKTPEIPGDSAHRASLFPASFSKLLTEVHRELEDELR